MCASSDLELFLDNFPSDIETQVCEMQDLSLLWAIRGVPDKTITDPIAFRRGSYPTLSYLVQRNINSLRHPVLTTPKKTHGDDSVVIALNGSLQNYSLK